MFQISNGTPVNVLIANYAADMPTSGSVNAYSDLTDGQIALVDGQNTVISPTSIVAYTTPVRLVVRNGSNLVYSDFIIGTHLLTATSANGAADTQQVSYLGYNGTSGSMDVFDQNEYVVNIEIKDEDVATGVYPYMKHATYYSTSSATQSAITLGLVTSAVANFKREPQNKITFEAVCSAAGTAISADAGDTVIGYKGSKILTIADATDNNNIAVLTVGDFVRVGTATTAGVYKIVSGSTTAAAGGTLTLDRELVADVSLGGTTAEYITAAQGAAADWGIKMTAVAHTNFVPGEQKHFLTTFVVTLPRGFESTEVTYTTAAAYGVGTYQEAAELEYLAQGNTGKLVYTGVPAFKSRNAASSANLYDRVTITFYEDGYSGLISNNPRNVKTLVIYSNDDNASPNDELKTIFGIS